MEASEAHKASLANVTPDAIARNTGFHGHATLTRRALPRPFTQDITGSNPVGGICRSPFVAGVLGALGPVAVSGARTRWKAFGSHCERPDEALHPALRDEDAWLPTVVLG
jgi:hypothetical protein